MKQGTFYEFQFQELLQGLHNKNWEKLHTENRHIQRYVNFGNIGKYICFCKYKYVYMNIKYIK